MPKEQSTLLAVGGTLVDYLLDQGSCVSMLDKRPTLSV